MSFKKQLEKKMKEKKLLDEYKTSSSKALFLFAAFIFFLNIFLVGADKSNSYGFLKFFLPLSYSLFVASLIFLSFAAVDKLLPEKYAKNKKVLHAIIIAIFVLPLLVFFIQRDFDTGL